MTISDAVLEIARRYNIDVEVSSKRLDYTESKSLGIYVFQDAGLSLKERKVFFFEGIGVAAQLHEVAHIITHIPGCDLALVRENYVLMQVERELARTMLTKKEFKDVVAWQQVTTCNDDEDLYEPNLGGKYWLDDVQWRDGYRRAQQVGLLDAKRRPTFQMPVWPADALNTYWAWMNEHDVINTGTPMEELRAG